eukprot:7241379-Pyramimonas_sp.AAC.1
MNVHCIPCLACHSSPAAPALGVPAQAFTVAHDSEIRDALEQQHLLRCESPGVLAWPYEVTCLGHGAQEPHAVGVDRHVRRVVVQVVRELRPAPPVLL